MLKTDYKMKLGSKETNAPGSFSKKQTDNVQKVFGPFTISSRSTQELSSSSITKKGKTKRKSSSKFTQQSISRELPSKEFTENNPNNVSTQRMFSEKKHNSNKKRYKVKTKIKFKAVENRQLIKSVKKQKGNRLSSREEVRNISEKAQIRKGNRWEKQFKK